MAGYDKFLAEERLREIATQIREVHVKAEPLSLTIVFRDWHLENFEYGAGSNPHQWEALFTHILDLAGLPSPSAED